MSDLGLRGLVCIVTGATRGLGRAVTDALIEEGALVLAVAYSQQRCDQLAADFAAANCDGLVIAQDLRDPEAGERIVAAAVEKWGRVDVVVNNGAGYQHKPLADLTREDWNDLFQLKVLGYWSLMVAAIPELTKTKGSITNIAGTAGVRAVPNVPHVGAVNSAIVSITRSYALGLAPVGVRVNCVDPGAIDTDRFATRVRIQAEESGISEEEARIQRSAGIPVGHPAHPQEIAQTILQLSSPRLRSLTGAHLIVDGGSTLRSLRNQ